MIGRLSDSDWRPCGLVFGRDLEESSSAMAKKKSGSSRRERRVAGSVLFTRPLTERQRRELERVAKMPDSRIDFSDAAEGKVQAAEIEVGRFFRRTGSS